MKRINEWLTGIPATVLSGVFLLSGFVADLLGKALPFDPAWVTVLISGLPLVYEAMENLIRNSGISRISSALLISVAMIAAVVTGDLFAAGEVAWIMAVGEILEDRTAERANRGLKKLISVAPVRGRRIVQGREETVPAENIAEGDILRVLPGEAIPVDGTVVRGETSVDQSVMTGESLPVDKTAGDSVFCGTVNCFGAIDIRATRVGEDSSLKKMIRLVEEAEKNKAPTARTADRAASWLVPAALLIAVLTGVITRDPVRAVTVLVVFCPCALVLATPVAIMAAIGQAAKHGVVIKSGEALEKMGRVNTVTLDKTGTLTFGRLEVCDVIPFDGETDEAELLSLAASAEMKSEHPTGKAIVSRAKECGAAVTEPDVFLAVSGKGVRAEIGGRSVLCGNEVFMKENGILMSSEITGTAEALRAEGKLSILVAADGCCVGALAMSDTLRPEAADLAGRLSALNTELVLLTGDNEKTAGYFAGRAGISRVKAELLPEDKVSGIRELQKAGETVCMVGDGVNDAPALKTADVGVAMGGLGSDIAVEAADAVLMRDDLSALPYLKRLSVATLKTIRFGIALSMGINVLAVILSVLGLLNPTLGALVHNAGSILVILIAVLLYDRKLD